MKKYTSIGQLLKDYRSINKQTRVDLAAAFDVDTRTVSRWEKNETLLKPDKEEEMVDITFIPYQVIRNLNAPVAIPVYYDFDLRKYSISEFSNELPDANWLKSVYNLQTDRIKAISTDEDIEYVVRSSMTQASVSKPITKEIILKATSLLPELNFIIYDTSGYYSGHSIYFPLKRSTYNKIKNREIKEEDITIDDFVDCNSIDNPVFFSFDISSDCNETLFYVSAALTKFFKSFNRDYTYASITSRHDNFKINEQLGTTLVWEDKELQKQLKSKAAPRLYENNRKF